MGFQRETNKTWTSSIDCYWESPGLNGQGSITYPSLPEPYINIFFPLHAELKPTIKGISSRADYFEVKSALFGVRLFLKGYYRLQLTHCSEISNKVVELESIGGVREAELTKAIASANSFEARVSLFRDYFEDKLRHPIKNIEENVSEAFQYLVVHYQDPGIIQDYAEHSGFSPRTISRWFSKEIGVSPKKLSRIIRFHTALSGIHSNPEPGFFYDCGFYDQAHYIREFKEFTGTTPDEYSKMMSDLYN